MRSRIVAITLCVLLFCSALCLVGLPEKGSAIDTVATTTEPPKPVETVLCSFKDIAYGNDEKQTFDLTLPVDSRESIGLLLYIHGGGWVGGDKSTAKNAFEVTKSNELYATASLNYRLAKDGLVDIYDIIDDITAALVHIKELAVGYNVNIDKLIIGGHSAGGHLSLLYAYRYKDISPIKIVGAIASAPASDISLDDFYKKNCLGDEEHMCELMSTACGVKFTKQDRAAYTELLQSLSPIYYVSADSVPTALLHGKKDGVVPYKSSENLSQKLTEYSVENDLIIFENSEHGLDKDKETRAYAETLLNERVLTWFGLNN